MKVNTAQASKAATLLGVELTGLTSSKVAAAFRSMSMKHHPDRGNYDAAKWHGISWARDTLKDWLKQPSDPVTLPAPRALGNCAACRGAGSLQRGRVAMMCVLCSGTGKVKLA